MPSYDYKCKECGQVTTVWQEIKAEKFTRSEQIEELNCGHDSDVVRLIGHGGPLNLLGAGFYCNEYESKSTEIKGSKTKNYRPTSTYKYP